MRIARGFLIGRIKNDIHLIGKLGVRGIREEGPRIVKYWARGREKKFGKLWSRLSRVC